MTPAQVAIPAVWAALIVGSVRAFWRRSEDPTKARYYSSAKFVSVFATLSSALLLPSVLSFDAPYWLNVIFWAVIGFPIILCGAYFSTRLFFLIVDTYMNK